MNYRFALPTLAAIAAVPALSAPAMAAPADESPSAAVLDEIVVTATRRETSSQEVPFSVHVLSAERLDRLGAYEFAGYSTAVPGLSFTNGSNGEKPVLRGVTTDQWIDINPTIALYLDETAITHGGRAAGPPYNPNPLLVDIDRIEILRGPQGTLFGDSAMGGAIRIITRRPDLNEASGFVESQLTAMTDGGLGYGFYAAANIPVTPHRFALRAVAYRRDPGGYIDNLASGAADVNNDLVSGGRISGAARLSEDLTVMLRTLYQRQEADGSNSELPADGPRLRSGVPEPRSDDWASVNASVEYDLGETELLFSSSWIDRRQDTKADVSAFLTLFFGVDNPMTVVNRLDSTTFIQELRLTSTGDDRINWLLGAYHQDRERFVNQDFPSPGFDALTGGMAARYGPPDNLFVRRERDTLRQFALYGDMTVALGERWSLGLGARRFDIDRSVLADNRGLLFIAGAVTDSAAAGSTGVTPRLSLSFRHSDELTLYATAAEGFRPGGTNRPEGSTEPACAAELETLGLTEFPPEYNPDRLWNYEVGLKSRWQDGRVQADVALYRIDWSDLQTDKFLQCGTSFTENAGAARNEGLELQLEAAMPQGTRLSLGVAYVDARLSEDVPNLNAQTGDRLPAVPRFTAHLALSHPFTAFGNDARAQLNHTFTGSSYNGFNRSTSQKLGAHHTTAAALQLEINSWSFEFFARNIFDSRGKRFVLDNVLGNQIVTQRPRIVGLGVGRTFN